MVMSQIIPYSVRTPKVASRAMEALVAPTAAIAIAIAETAHSLIFHLWTNLIKNRISHLSITKSGPQSIQLNKILEAISLICQDEHYDSIPGIFSSNTKSTQEYFFSDSPIKR